MRRRAAALALVLAGSGGPAAAVPVGVAPPPPDQVAPPTGSPAGQTSDSRGDEPSGAAGAGSGAGSRPGARAGAGAGEGGGARVGERPAGSGTWPLDPPAVAAGFDPPAQRWGRGHRGVDLAGRRWQPVRAALGGVVRHAGPVAGRGVVVVDHGGRRTTYEPVDPGVEVGDRVAAGDRLGRLELAGSHCPPAACLHWGWRRGEAYLDPLDLVGGGLVGGGRVRLKPVGGPAGTPAAAGRW